VKFLVDMNLSPGWVPFLQERGVEAVHWSNTGAATATDAEIMQWARTNGFVVLTHDLDFGILLAHSKDGRPSVVQVRAQDVSPGHLGTLIITALRTWGEALEQGAILTIDESRARVRILPL